MDLAVKQLIEATGFDLGNLDTLESHSMTVSTPEVSADSMEALSTNLAVGALAPVLVVLDRFTLFTSFPFELRLKIVCRPFPCTCLPLSYTHTHTH
jgi:hypothetical protein